jgi:hypothetical protein
LAGELLKDRLLAVGWWRGRKAFDSKHTLDELFQESAVSRGNIASVVDHGLGVAPASFEVRLVAAGGTNRRG